MIYDGGKTPSIYEESRDDGNEDDKNMMRKWIKVWNGQEKTENV